MVKQALIAIRDAMIGRIMHAIKADPKPATTVTVQIKIDK